MDVHEAHHEVGVRDLRRELSRWLDVVADGAEITVTERGKPVARIVGVDSEDALTRMAEAGLVQRPTRPRRPAREIPRARARGSVADLVADQRR